MASLVNIHTGNNTRLYTVDRDRLNANALALNQPRRWDIPSLVPVTRIRPDTAPDPQFVEMHDQIDRNYFVPVNRPDRSLPTHEADNHMVVPALARVMQWFRGHRSKPY